MKKFIALVIFLALTVIFIPWLHPARAADQKVDVYENHKLVKSVVFKIGVPYYVVDGQTPGVKMDVAPFIQNDRTFVPVRFLGNALGVDNSNITWDNNTQTATLKGNATLKMTIGKAQITSNGQARAIDPGVSGEAEPGGEYTAAVDFRNDSGQALTGVPVGGFNREYRAVLKDADGNEVQYADFAPGETKTFCKKFFGNIVC